MSDAENLAAFSQVGDHVRGLRSAGPFDVPQYEELTPGRGHRQTRVNGRVA
ncbi:hypothetical protein [Williamsia muralis]|uniref:hypothetical protein n=1 Tax=Williamsia marianensis TaxID=85044 RepID=UPI00167086D2|nr:hypothetical protein [Williamsia marianensis]